MEAVALNVTLKAACISIWCSSIDFSTHLTELQRETCIEVTVAGAAF
jgi:hypothetical protein